MVILDTKYFARYFLRLQGRLMSDCFVAMCYLFCNALDAEGHRLSAITAAVWFFSFFCIFRETCLWLAGVFVFVCRVPKLFRRCDSNSAWKKKHSRPSNLQFESYFLLFVVILKTSASSIVRICCVCFLPVVVVGFLFTYCRLLSRQIVNLRPFRIWKKKFKMNKSRQQRRTH